MSIIKPKKRTLIKLDLKYIWDQYKKHKKNVIVFSSFAVLCFFLSMVFIGGKLFYPFHFFIGLILLSLSIYNLKRGFLCFDKKLSKLNSVELSIKYGKKYKRYLVVAIVLFFISYIFYHVYYFENSPFGNLSYEEVDKLLATDLQKAVVLMDNLQLEGDKFIGSELLKKKDLTVDEREELVNLWNNFIVISMESEKVTEVHKYFNHIPFITRPRQNSISFMISYSLYVKKYEFFQRLIDIVNGNEYIKKILNEKLEFTNTNNHYDDIVDRYYEASTMLRLTFGDIYDKYVGLFNRDKNYNTQYHDLKAVARNSYSYLTKNIDSTIINGIRSIRFGIERDMFDAWLPIQKNTASLMGRIHISPRHEKFITFEQIDEMKKRLEPGDIMVQRRNWYGSNIGIPGFWPHAALYTGRLEDMDKYFEEIFPIEGYNDLVSYIENKYPKAYKKFTKQDEHGFYNAVIEGKAPGVILQPLEISAYADYIGVMRPRLEKLDKFKAIMRAFSNYGKPYDYDFDFDTKDFFVCSELVWDAYLPAEGKNGLNFNVSIISGRKIVTATDMVKKFVDEYESDIQELDFVYFLDGNEKLSKAFLKGEEEFLKTWERPKYDWFQE